MNTDHHPTAKLWNMPFTNDSPHPTYQKRIVEPVVKRDINVFIIDEKFDGTFQMAYFDKHHKEYYENIYSVADIVKKYMKNDIENLSSKPAILVNTEGWQNCFDTFVNRCCCRILRYHGCVICNSRGVLFRKHHFCFQHAYEEMTSLDTPDWRFCSSALSFAFDNVVNGSLFFVEAQLIFQQPPLNTTFSLQLQMFTGRPRDGDSYYKKKIAIFDCVDTNFFSEDIRSFDVEQLGLSFAHTGGSAGCENEMCSYDFCYQSVCILKKIYSDMI